VAYQKHHVPPCVVMGWAASTDRWCQGCTLFCLLSDEVQAKLEDEAMRKSRQQRGRR
jgi:hypothetical protein